MKKRKSIALFLAGAMLAGVLAGCGGGQKAESGTIKIALITNTTGDYAQYGKPVHDGAMLYISQLNEKGGINGKKIEVLEYDDKADGVESVNAFNQAMGKGITAVIGSVLTGATVTLADATYEKNVPQITASATAAGVTMINPDDPNSAIRTNVFRSCFIDPFQGEKMADYAVKKLGAKTAGILYESGSDYSEGLLASFEAKAKELGLQITAKEAFASGDKDFNAQMTKLAQAAPDVIFMPFYYTEAGPAITQGRQAGFKGVFVGADGFGGIRDYATAADLEGTVYCSGYAPGTPSVAQFEKDFCAAYKVDQVPNMFAPLAYDAAMLMCKALEAAEKTGKAAGSAEYMQAAIDALKGMSGVEGITGSYTFDAYNNPIKSAAILQLQGGQEVFTELF